MELISLLQLKGCKKNEIKSEIEKILETLGLAHKIKAQSKTLSGGMKRKLSVGIALIGGSKVNNYMYSDIF